MSVNALRALVLLANVLLIGLLVWLIQSTFLERDLSRYDVKPPKEGDFEVTERGVDPRTLEKPLYLAIGRVFDPTPPPPPEPVKPPPPPPPTKPSPRDIKVIAVNYAEDQQLASALLQPPGASEPHFMQVGLDLGQIAGYGFDAYKGCMLTRITQDGEVIVTDQEGKEVKLQSPRPITQKAGGR